jgi:hypothetical protein
MSPIIDLQRRLVEVGRIRMGTSEPGKRGGRKPVRLETWRLTSRDTDRLEAAASLYGGVVRPWDGRAGEYELVTQVTALPVMLIPGQALSQWWELWGQRDSGAHECLRRCDGETEVLSGGPCQCPSVYDERRELAAEGRACKPHTRLSVLLPEVAGIGCWRLETAGFYAAVELGGVATLLEEVTRRGVLVPARLRIDQRSVRRGGSMLKFPVPVIDIDARPTDLMRVVGGPEPLEASSARPALPAGYKPAEPQPGPTVTEAMTITEAQARARSDSAQRPAPIGRKAPIPRPPSQDDVPLGEDADSPQERRGSAADSLYEYVAELNDSGRARMRDIVEVMRRHGVTDFRERLSETLRLLTEEQAQEILAELRGRYEV